MRKAGLSLLLALPACGMGPVDLTLIDDVRLVTAIAEPPEAAVDELVQLTAIVANPTSSAVDVLLWQCGPPELPCLTHHEVLQGDEVSSQFLPAFPVWVLACRDGLCGDLAAPSEDDLRDPYSWLQSLPIEGVAAGNKIVPLTELPPEERHQNPVIVESPDVPIDGVAPEAPEELSFRVPGGTLASGLATAGGFDKVSTDVSSEGDVTVSWYAPSDPGSAKLYVVFDDAYGGTALWRAEATVAP